MPIVNAIDAGALMQMYRQGVSDRQSMQDRQIALEDRRYAMEDKARARQQEQLRQSALVRLFAGGAPSTAIDESGAVSQPSYAPPSPSAPAPEPAGNGRLFDITANTESRNRDYANGRPVRSPKGALYAMQVMPATNRDPGFGVRAAADGSPEESNRVGRDYLVAMKDRYGGDMAKAWAAYNWGPGNLDRALQAHGENWLQAAPAETRAYVAKNMAALGGDANDRSTWGNRADGSAKGTGWLGVIQRPDGGVSTEISVGVNIDGKETEIPLLVPGLDQQEIAYLTKNNPDQQANPDFLRNMPPSIMQKAVQFARQRVAQGLSPFKQDGEGGQQNGPINLGDLPHPSAHPAYNKDAMRDLMIIDPEMAMKFLDHFTKASKEEREQFETRNAALGQAAQYLSGFPPAQRGQALRAVAPQLMAAGMTREELEKADLSDNGLKGYVAMAIDVDKLLTNARSDAQLDETKRHNRSSEEISRGNLGLAREREARVSKWGPQPLIGVMGNAPTATDDLNY
ncbi:lytic transglycosylase domain-containing protein [Rhizorhapis sp.]|uniref:lytic transglycosylase domain-containing protein n=1 Tax=Rhizorhapis sp. TaxID=1968842 RepID=UPI002B473F82|nr:lytic transglycosylase domain-containing protein [Rhizorhapis sp.]HKR17728.1 lytic transglycosylase domain-containing protein [Rhizorhapis sp.]